MTPEFYELHQKLEMEMDIPANMDLFDSKVLASLPSTPTTDRMLELLGGSRYTKAVQGLSRKECYVYLSHAKKWHNQAFNQAETVIIWRGLFNDAGKKFNLSAVPTGGLQEMVLDIYPDKLPTLISEAKASGISYRGMQDTLRVIRDFGLSDKKLRLNAKTSVMYEQMASVFGANWVDNWSNISNLVSEYQGVAKLTASKLGEFVSNV